jgi:hypothetical protein
MLLQVILIASILGPLVAKEEENRGFFECPDKKMEVPKSIDRKDVYKGKPYGVGESAKYETRYWGTLSGYGTLETRSPKRHSSGSYPSLWHRNFHISAKSGDWYKLVFRGRYEVDSIVRPWDGAGARFHIDQDEAMFTGKKVNTKRWISFDHEKCSVDAKRDREGNVREGTHPLSYQAMDTLGVVYWLREQEFVMGKVIRGLVYSNEKSWWLDATPVAEEKIKTDIGEFDTVKLSMKTYLGDIAQQKGTVFIWIAHKHKNRPLIQGEAEIAIGKVSMKLVEFKPGT